MQNVYKFISYFKNGVLEVQLSEPITWGINGRVNITHANICKKLQEKGVVSEQIISVGSFVCMNGKAILIEHTPTIIMNIDDIVQQAISKHFLEDSKQGLLDFGR